MRGARESDNTMTTAAGYYQIGEIHRRRGDFAAAEEAYQKAFELGREPQPGQALLRLAQGKADAAAAAIRRSLVDEDKDPFTRARRLPAQIEVALAVGDLETARTAAEEVEEITNRFRVNGERTPLLDGALQVSRARIAAAEDDWEASEAAARKGARDLDSRGGPLREGRGAHAARHGLRAPRRRRGRAGRVRGRKETFERLGAVLDAERTMELLGEEAATRTFVFTDIVGSTGHLVQLGEEKWKELLDRHDALLTAAIREHSGTIIKHTGDGFFAAFATPAKPSRPRSRSSGRSRRSRSRFGSGSTAAKRSSGGNDYAGRGVNVAARIGALAAGGRGARLHRHPGRGRDALRALLPALRGAKGLRRAGADRRALLELGASAHRVALHPARVRPAFRTPSGSRATALTRPSDHASVTWTSWPRSRSSAVTASPKRDSISSDRGS